MLQIVWSILVTLTLSGAAHADGDDGEQCQKSGSQKLQQCQQTKCDAIKACKAASDKAVGASNTAAGGLQTKYKDGKQINSSAGDSTTVQSGTAKLLGDAITACDTEKPKCQKACKPEQAEKKEKLATKDTLDACNKGIEDIKTPLAKGKADAEGASKGSDDTKSNSGGQMPPMQMPQKDDKKDDDSSSADTSSPSTTPTPTPTAAPSPTPSPSPDTQSTGSSSSAVTPATAMATATDCSGNSGFPNSCLESFTKTCLNTSSPVCTQFNNRYCGNGVSGGMEGPDDIKAGSGAGADYCSTKTAQSFCGAGGRDSCDACRKLKGQAPLPAEQQASACGIDPSSLPTLQKNGSSSALGMSSLGGSSGGSSASGASPAAASNAPVNAVKENEYDKLKSAMNMSAEGGGGGGGPSNAGGAEASGDAQLADLASGYGIIGRGPSSSDAGVQNASVNATDIGGFNGPKVFRLVEDVYLAKCAAKKYPTCPPRP